MRRSNYLTILALIYSFNASSQDRHELIFPDSLGWNTIEEGATRSFQLGAFPDMPIRYAIVETESLGFTFDSLGHFTWTPTYDLVNRVELKKDFTIIFEGLWDDGTRIRKTVTFSIVHSNRPPVADELPPFYVKQSTHNNYTISSEYIYDPDGDPIVFKSIVSQMPEGLTLNSQGQFSWTLSRNQFNALKTKPAIIEFIVQDQPGKAETIGRLRIAQTQLDLPPEILIVPADSLFTIKEDETLNLKLYLSDPNGDDDIRIGGFVSSDARIPKSSLKENTPLQYEFFWQPGYDFVQETKGNLPCEIVFFALDKSNNRSQKKIKVIVDDAENLIEKDALQYIKYKNNLLSATDLLKTLDENQKKLNEDFKRAKKGKKKRSVANASLGAVTGLSPTLLEPDQSKVVSTVGGTTVLTINTLEATEVIGRSKDDIMDKIKINTDIRNRVQSSGDEFARKYASKTSRRSIDIDKDIDKLRTTMNDQRIILLELDAFKKTGGSLTTKDINKAFPDFTEEDQ